MAVTEEVKSDEKKVTEAYEMGYETAIVAYGIEEMSDDEKARLASEALEGYDQGAVYANNILPSLRALAGYEDGGYGTYNIEPSGESVAWLYDSLVEAWRTGYIDKTVGDKKDVEPEAHL